jgi:hypothetical protein
MKTADVIKHFGSKAKTARATGLSKQAISAWGERVPKGSAAALHVLTRGRLKYHPSDYISRQRRASAG